MNRRDIESFFRTLLLGDFEENQNTAAQIVGGLISLVPVLDQVMDARDITGALFNINKHGGFDNANADQLVNLGFAAFGAIPEVGSAFKTVFKPLWKERRAAKGAVHSGLNAIEALLGMRKGGAVEWIRKELIGKWGSRTTQAIAAVNAGLAACIELTEFIATASGWKDWLIPDPVQELAKEMLPHLKAMKGKLDQPLQRASNEIRAFLEDLLGEQAAAVVMAAGQRALAASAVPGTRARAGHNAAESKPKGAEPKRQPEQKVQSAQKADVSKGAGAVHTARQATSKAFRELANMEKGLVGEHMADYHEMKRLGGNWQHDKSAGQWSLQTVRKINADKRPVNLSLADLTKMISTDDSGVDAVWEHNGSYTVTEAKARVSVFAVVATLNSLTNKGLVPASVRVLSKDLQTLWLVLSTDNKDVVGQGWPLVQMSQAWVADRGERERGLPNAAKAALTAGPSRRVLLITLESTGAPDHGMALVDIHAGKLEADVHLHAEHGICREWEGADIDKVVAACKDAHDAKRARKAEQAAREPASRPEKKSAKKPAKAGKP